MLRLGRSLTIVCLLLGVCGLPSGGWAQEKRTPVPIEGKTVLPLRVLTRAHAAIYKEADASKGIVVEDVPTFKVFYVYTRPKVNPTETNITGWYEVGDDNRGHVLGWMKADDVLEWQQNLTLAYTHPEGRKQVLMFEKREALLDLIKAQSDKRKQRAEEIYATIDSAQKLPTDFPVRSIEPKGYIDISSQFYLLPILAFADSGLDVYDAKLLKVAAAVLKGERKQSVINTGETGKNDYLEEARSGNRDSADMLKKVEMDVVFVIDTTRSMQPIIDATLDAVKNIALTITQDPTISQSVHFGLWCYRDSLDIPGIEYLTKNFTPTLQPVEDFAQTLRGVHEAGVGSQGFEEDMFSGVTDAITKTAWTPNALQFLVLVADAPSHAPGDSNPAAYPAWNASGQDEKTLRQYATDSHVWIAALHARESNPQYERFHALAEKQFRTLATNPGAKDASQAAYWTVKEEDPNAFAQVTRDLAGSLVKVIAEAKKGGQLPTAAAVTPPPGATPPAVAPPPGGAQPSPEQAARTLGHAALVQFLGRETETQAPRDVIAWVVDKDLLDPALVSMEPRLLINKRDIDELRKVLQDVMAAGRGGQIGGKDFFTVLQTIPLVSTRLDPSRVRQAQSMAELVPEFLQGLPYKSALVALSNSLWASWTDQQQNEFLDGIDAKIHLYQTIHDASDKWVKFHDGDAPDEYVYPLALDSLP